MKTLKGKLIAFLSLLLMSQAPSIAFAQTEEEITRGIPWFILMIIVIIIAIIYSALQKKKRVE
jgi:heme/copper-type cytochrome/quinol oxidase subunit 2